MGVVETPAQIGARADQLLAELRPLTGNILLFSHGHFLRVLAARWLGLPPSDGRFFALSVASLSILGFERGQPVLKLWNESYR
ncbi:MAG TPA: histidine phosphatase family protein [Chlamydiales bacterium]|nr:histidine phosphatase family protein [Chlamydiales bacterium]